MKDRYLRCLRWMMVLAVVVLCGSSSVKAEDWTRWRGPGGNGISVETDWLDRWAETGPPVLWRGSVGTGFSSFAVSAGRVYTMGNRDEMDVVTCLDAETGALIWSYAYACPLEDRLFEGGPTSTPTVDGEVVYTISRAGDVFCLDAVTGAVRWSTQILDKTGVRQPGWGFGSSPLVYGDILLLNAGENGVALDTKTGEIVWASADKEAGYCTPVVYQKDGVACAVLANSRYFVGIEIESGRKLWQYRWLTRYGVHAADPIVIGKRVMIASGYGKGAAMLDLTDGEPAEVWKSKELRTQLNGCVLIEGYLYGIDGDAESDATLRCVDAATGETVWSEEGFGFGSVTAAGGRLILLTEGGELVVAKSSAEGFVPLSRAVVLGGKCWTVPVLANGRLYARNADGEVVCLDLRVKD